MFEIKIKPMSLGRAWSQSKNGRRFLIPEAKKYKLLISSHCKGMYWLHDYDGAIFFIAEFHGPWLTKQGKISKTAGDVDNFSKLILDSLCESYGFDDSQVTEIKLQKFLADEWMIRLSLSPTSLEEGKASIPY